MIDIGLGKREHDRSHSRGSDRICCDPSCRSIDRTTRAQSMLERSNVNVVNEMVNLITAQRAYEINSRAIKVGDEMLADATNLIR